MIKVQKVRGENKIKPISMSIHEYNVAKKMGLTPTEFINKYVKAIAKKRRWTWYFEKKASAK